ncbi:MAG TPA: serine/threonine-protein kinase, partial [Kofleriaceae bacterium]
MATRLGDTGTTEQLGCGSPISAAPGASFGRFEATRVLGRGAMGVVIAAYDPELDRSVAIKVLEAHGDADARARRLQGEAQAMAKLAHPNVVSIYEVGRTGDQLFIAMELVDGITLDEWLDEVRPWREIVEMFIAAGRGLQAAHDSGIVHRDFKPANVLVGRDGRPRVGDFGIAIRGSGDARRGIGTPGYMSAEQWTGGEIDSRSDQFAFCVALWRAVWRQAPFRDDDHETLCRAVVTGPRPVPPHGPPRWLGPLLVRGLEREPAARWPTLGALLDELGRRLTIRRRVSWLGVAASTVAAATAMVIVTSTRDVDAPCTAPTDRVERV